MKSKVKQLKTKGGFTIIELIVVIAILGILVLLAMWGYKGYVEKAKIVQIKHDVKIAEQVLAADYLAKGTSLPDNWVNTKPENSVNNIYDTRGLVDPGNIKPGDYKLFPKGEIGSKLPGDFHAGEDGKVYYEDNKVTEDKPISDDEIADLINAGFIPVANADELQQINGNYDPEYSVTFKELTWGTGTKWEGQYVGTLDSKYIQVKDIDLSGFASWVPIGLDPGVPFTGQYNGGNFTIRNLSVSEGNHGFNGLFGDIEGSESGSEVSITNLVIDNYSSSSGSLLVDSIGMNNYGKPAIKVVIENIKIKNGNISSSNANFSGSLVSDLNASIISIRNIQVEGSINALNAQSVGGLVGFAKNSMENIVMESIEVNMSIVGGDYTDTGGIIGKVQMNNIQTNKIKFNGSVDGGKSGGFAGVIIPDYKDIYKTIVLQNIDIAGAIRGIESAGGIVGSSSIDIEFKDSKFDGNLYGEEVGGIIGVVDGGLSSFNNLNTGGNYTGESVAGGIVGRFSNTSFYQFTNVNSSSNLRANKVGGIVAVTNGADISIINSSYAGDISPHDEEIEIAGGLIGQVNGSDISILNSSSKGILSAKISGGLVGVGQGSSIIIEKSSVALKIIGYEFAGGAVSSNSGNIDVSDFEFSGEIQADTVGGVVANVFTPSVTITNANVNGVLNGYSHSGAYVGSTYEGLLESIEINSETGIIPNIGFIIN